MPLPQSIAALTAPGTVWAAARNTHDRISPHWIGKDWSFDELLGQPADDPFWLYKPRERYWHLLRYLDDLERHAKLHRSERRSLAQLLDALAGHVAEMWRGIWPLECYLSGEQLPDVSETTSELAFSVLDTIHRLDEYRKVRRRATDTDLTTLRGQAERIRARYEHLFAMVPEDFRPPVLRP